MVSAANQLPKGLLQPWSLGATQAQQCLDEAFSARGLRLGRLKVTLCAQHSGTKHCSLILAAARASFTTLDLNILQRTSLHRCPACRPAA